MKRIPEAVTVEVTAFTREERDAKGTDIGSKVQEIEQELLHQIRANEMKIQKGKLFTDYVSKKVVGQKTAVIVLLVVALPTLSEAVLGLKEGLNQHNQVSLHCWN